MRTSLFWLLIQFMCLKLLKYLFNDVLFIAGEGTLKLISLLLKKSALRDGFEDVSRLAAVSLLGRGSVFWVECLGTTRFLYLIYKSPLLNLLIFSLKVLRGLETIHS